MNKRKHKIVSIILIMTLVLTTAFVPSAFAGNNSVEVDTLSLLVINEDGNKIEKDLTIVASYEGLEEEVTAINNETGYYEFPSTTTLVEGAFENNQEMGKADISFEIKPNSKIYETKTTTIEVSEPSDLLLLKQAELEYAEYPQGQLLMKDYDTKEDSPLPSTKVVAELTDGTAEVVTDENGNFSFKGIAASSEIKNLLIKDTDEYEGNNVSMQSFASLNNKITVEERWEAKDNTIFKYGNEVFINEGKYSVRYAGNFMFGAIDNTEISKTLEGRFYEDLEVRITEEGAEPIYIKNREGKISKPYSAKIYVDNKAPVVTDIKCESSVLNFTDFGIFGNKEADLKVTITATDELSGVKEMYLFAQENGGQKNIKPEDIIKDGEKYQGEFIIPDVSDTYEATLNVVVCDNFGNESTACLLLEDREKSTIYIEKEKPVVESFSLISTKKDGFNYTDTFTAIKFKVTEALSGINAIKLEVNNEEVKSYTFTKETKVYEEELNIDTYVKQNPSTDGKYTVKITALDNAGNEICEEKSIFYDGVAPEVALKGCKEGDIYKEAPTITVNVSDNYVEKTSTKFKVFLDNEVVDTITSTGENSFTYDDFKKDGTYTLEAVTTDAAGNLSNSAKLSFVLDTTKAKTEISVTGEKSSSSNNWYNGKVDITVSATDETSGLLSVVTKIAGTTIGTESFDGSSASGELKYSVAKNFFEENQSKNGQYTILVTTTDIAGNVSEKEEVIKCDVVKPEISLSGIDNNAHYGIVPTLEIEIAEKYTEKLNATVTVTRDGQNIDKKSIESETSFTYNQFKVDGDYTVTVEAIDEAGNKAESKSISFTYDTTLPAVTLSGVEKDKHYNEDQKVSLKAIERNYDVTKVTVLVERVLDGQTTTESFSDTQMYQEDSDFETTFTKNGTYTIKATATDKAGNTSTSNVLSFTIDKEKPVITLEGITANKHYNKAPKLSVTLDDSYMETVNAVIKVYRDGKEVDSKEYTGKDSLSYSNFTKDGVYKVVVSAKDKAGNEADMKTISFVYDTTPAKLVISGAVNNEYYASAKEVVLSVKELNYKELKVDVSVVRELDGTKTTETFKSVDPSAVDSMYKNSYSKTGTYTIIATATDEAGNKSTSNTLVFTIDTVNPVVKISGVSTGENGYEAVVMPVIKYSDSYYASKKITLTNMSGQNTSGLSYTTTENSKGGTVTYANFAKDEVYDGYYTLSVEVKDKAGNSSKDEIKFSVNRFGSKFELSEYVKNLNGGYVKDPGNKIVINETNVSKLSEIEGRIVKDGESMPGELTSTLTNVNGWNHYEHAFDSKAFKKEGIYTVSVVSKDAAGNVNDSSQKAEPVTFYIDKTAPLVSLTGINEGMISTEKVEAQLYIADSLALAEYTVLVNGKEVDQAKFEGGEVESKTKFTVGYGKDQVVKIIVKDKAGNETIHEVGDITISTDFFTKIYANKVLFYGLIVTAGLLVVASGGLIIASKRKKK